MRESTFSPSFPICSPSPMVVEVVVVEEVVEVVVAEEVVEVVVVEEVVEVVVVEEVVEVVVLFCFVLFSVLRRCVGSRGFAT